MIQLMAAPTQSEHTVSVESKRGMVARDSFSLTVDNFENPVYSHVVNIVVGTGTRLPHYLTRPHQPCRGTMLPKVRDMNRPD